MIPNIYILIYIDTLIYIYIIYICVCVKAGSYIHLCLWFHPLLNHGFWGAVKEGKGLSIQMQPKNKAHFKFKLLVLALLRKWSQLGSAYYFSCRENQEKRYFNHHPGSLINITLAPNQPINLLIDGQEQSDYVNILPSGKLSHNFFMGKFTINGDFP